MVRIKGPMQSTAASGTIADAAVFSSWKGRAYARRHITPTNPRSPMQVSTRAMMSFLVTRFSDLSIPEKATWQALAAKDLIPTYNAYLAANLERWRQFLAPSQAYPAAENGVLGDIDYWQATGGPAHVDLAADWYGIENNWGIIIFRSTSTGFTPSRSNAIAVVPHLLTSGTFYSDTGLPPATYYYKLRNFTTTGKLSTPSGQASATVT